MRKIIAILLVCLSCSYMLLACDKKENETNTTTTTSDKEVASIPTDINTFISTDDDGKTVITSNDSTGKTTTTVIGSDGTITTSTDEANTPVVKPIESLTPTEPVTVSDAENIKLDGKKISYSGSNASVSGSTITILSGGTFNVTGTLTDGQIIVDAKKQDVELIINSVQITCSNSAPIYVKNASQVILTLPAGTLSTLTDGTSYTYTDTEKEEPSATIFSKGDLVIEGGGTLSINANFNNGIESKDTLIISDSTIYVTSINHAIKGKDCVSIKNSKFNLTCGGDGIKASNSEDPNLGYITIDSGEYVITSNEEAMQAETSILIKNGTFAITSAQDSIKSATETTIRNGIFKIVSAMDAIQADTVLTILDGIFDIETNGGSINASTAETWGKNDFGKEGFQGHQVATETTTESAKALKAMENINISGGVFKINSSDDAIHTNADIEISNAKITISSGDDGIHADSEIILNNGTITIEKSYEGIEGQAITINGGIVNVTANDDGFNCAGGNDNSSLGTRPGRNDFSEDTKAILTINGGTIYVNSSGDGLDSNGSMVINGGDIIVFGPTNNGNGSLDATSISVNGGSLVAIGSAGMAETPDTTSKLCTVAVTLSSGAAAESVISIKDSNDKEIYSIKTIKQYQSIIYSSELLVLGNTYSLYIDGTKITDFTMSSNLTVVGSGGFGGGGFGGGGFGDGGFDDGGFGGNKRPR